MMNAKQRGRGRSQQTLDLTQCCKEILDEIAPASVRAVCYRLFAAQRIPSMADGETDRIGVILKHAREEGVIGWEQIVDDTRRPERIACWEDPAAYAATVAESYRRNFWLHQPRRVEVWSEKGTVSGTLAEVLEKFGVTFRVFHGFSSATALHTIAEETKSLAEPLIALYVGDYDPAGMCMSGDDLPERLARYGAAVELRRYALVKEDLPALARMGATFPASAKTKGPGSRRFVERYGNRCAELDALNPVVLRHRVEDAIAAQIDWKAWKRCERLEATEQSALTAAMNRWVKSNSKRARK